MEKQFVKVNEYSYLDLSKVLGITSNEIGRELTFIFENGKTHVEYYEDFSAHNWLNNLMKNLLTKEQQK